MQLTVLEATASHRGFMTSKVDDGSLVCGAGEINAKCKSKSQKKECGRGNFEF